MENQQNISTPQPTDDNRAEADRPPQKFMTPMIELPARFSMLVYLTDGVEIAFRVQVDLSSGVFPRKKEIKEALAHVCKVAQDNYFAQHKIIKKFRVMNKREFFNRIVYEEKGMAGDFAPADLGEFNKDDVGESASSSLVVA